MTTDMIRVYRVQVDLKPEHEDWRGRALLPDVAALGIEGLEAARVANLYFVAGKNLAREQVQRLADELLVDPVMNTCGITELGTSQPPAADPAAGSWIVEVCLLPGVTDSEAESLLAAAHRIGIAGLNAAASAHSYLLTGSLSEAAVRTIAERLLSNPVIQRYALGRIVPDLGTATRGAGDRVATVPLSGLGDAELLRLSRQRVLFLNLSEMRAIQAYFAGQHREPTDVELETLAQTWSEHCGHKTFKASIEYTERTEEGTSGQQVDGILRTFLARATQQLAKPWVRSAFVDNAGIIDFDSENEVSFKVETHNHPSALEPFGGANTGVGGVVRDIIGVSARPIANTDVLCFGHQDTPFEALPESILHPRRIFRGVVAGIEDYGNKMGIPTVNGAILFDDGYLANPLVYCGCVGIAPKGAHPRGARPGDAVVMLGGRIGRDGLHGATFSSAELAHDTGATVGSVVQIGNPITEKKVLEVIMQARDRRLYTAITDCGAGGLSSAVGEMGEATGVSVDLANAPLKYPGLDPWEIWESEAQERMVLAVAPENLQALRAICDQLDVEMTVIGQFTDDKRLRVYYSGRLAADLDMDFLHNGNPRRHMVAEWVKPPIRHDPPPPPADLNAVLFSLLRSPNIASKEAVIHLYDHEVQAATVVKPLTGPQRDGPGDAAVLRSTYARDQRRAIALGCGINPRYAAVDPYRMAIAAIDEAIRNVTSVGADPEQTALLDNFCWGNPDLPDRLGSLVRAAKGCYDGALAFGAPFISGKDSLNNEYSDGVTGRRISIPPTLLISSIAIVPDIAHAVTMDLKEAGDIVFILGQTRNEFGGSHYGLILGEEWGEAPAPAPQGPELARRLHAAIRAGLVRACHDCSEGGLAVAAAEMCIAGRLGLQLDIGRAPLDSDVTRTDLALFAESNSRYIVEVTPANADAFDAMLTGLPHARAGNVVAEPYLRILGLQGEEAVRAPISELVYAWTDQSYARPKLLAPGPG